MTKLGKKVLLTALISLVAVFLSMALLLTGGIFGTQTAEAAGSSWSTPAGTVKRGDAYQGNWVKGGSSTAISTTPDGEYTKITSWGKSYSYWYNYSGASTSTAEVQNINGLQLKLKIPYSVFSAGNYTGVNVILASSPSTNGQTQTNKASGAWNWCLNVFRQAAQQLRICFSSSHYSSAENILDDTAGNRNIAYANQSGSSTAWGNFPGTNGDYILLQSTTDSVLCITVNFDTKSDALYNSQYAKATVSLAGSTGISKHSAARAGDPTTTTYTAYLDGLKIGGSLAGSSPYRTYIQISTAQNTSTGNDWGICVGSTTVSNTLTTSGTVGNKTENSASTISKFYGDQYVNNPAGLSLDGLTIDYTASGINFASGNSGTIGVSLLNSSSANPATAGKFMNYVLISGTDAAIYFGNGANSAYYMSSAGVLSPFWGSSGEMYVKLTSLSSSSTVRVIFRIQNCKSDTYTFSDIFPSGYVILQYTVFVGSTEKVSNVNSQIIYLDGSLFSDTCYLSVYGSVGSSTPFKSTGGQVSLSARWNLTSSYTLTLRNAACTGTQNLTYMNSRNDVWTYIQLPYRKDALGNSVAYYKVSSYKFYPGDMVTVAALDGQTLVAYYLDIAINGTSVNNSSSSVKYSGLATRQYTNSIFDDVTATEIGIIVFPTDKVANVTDQKTGSTYTSGTGTTGDVITSHDTYTLAKYPSGSGNTKSYNATTSAPASGDFVTCNVTISSLNTYNYGRDIAVRGYVRVGSTYYYGWGGTYSKSAHYAACEALASGTASGTNVTKFAESSLEVTISGDSGSFSVAKTTLSFKVSGTTYNYTQSSIKSLAISNADNVVTLTVVLNSTSYLQSSKFMALYVTVGGVRVRYAISSQTISSNTLTLTFTIKG